MSNTLTVNNKSIRLHIFISEARNSLFGSVTYSIAVRHAQMFHKLRKTFFPFHFGKAGRMASEEVLLELVKVNVCGMLIILYGSESLSAQI